MSILLQAATGTGGSGMGGMLFMLIAIFAIFYFFMIRPQQKNRKSCRKAVSNEER